MTEQTKESKRGRHKGMYGDRYRLKRSTVLMALAIFIFIVILVVYGMIRYDSRKNIFTVMAILSVLPFAKLCSILSTMLPYPSMPAAQAQALMSLEEGKEVVYDVIFSTEKTVYPIDCMVIEDGRLLVFSPVKDKKQKMLQEALRTFLKTNGNGKFTVKIESDFDTFRGLMESAAHSGGKSRSTRLLAESFLANCV